MLNWRTIVFLLLLAVAPASAADLREGIEQLAAGLAKSVPDGRPIRVAVADVPNLQNVTCELGRYIAERLTTRLSAQAGKFQVIERRRLSQVLGELRFSMSDLVDARKAKQLGQMLGIEGLVTGSLSDLGNVVEVDARIVEIESNRMLPGVANAISKDQTVRDLLERGCVVAVVRSESEEAPQAQPVTTGPEASAVFATEGGLRFDARACEIGNSGFAGPALICTIGVTNMGARDRSVKLYGSNWKPGSWVLDGHGNRYNTSFMEGNRVSGNFAADLAPNVPSNVTFVGIVGEKQVRATHATIIISFEGATRLIVLRNVPITK